ncbi:hypothetical protein NWP22_07725 [Anabaenopsis tanganyikae CS-531]|uniref:Uncharacterized protein n=2 Tax=Anabaenopsis TaxID=110103 RepID=A0ABT6KD08_9CYAN|nr:MULTISPECIES: hypothetical protein [Anabaenopsis]MDB9540626.1 hypothetical protein [Anabaenopsis arnoldii]MDH6093064.1 hypothetical protein [Anabaenopsis arnoldii]MDH6105754.1 hypothetical protein [Anabaenopsis tanganyikae CS-531]
MTAIKIPSDLHPQAEKTHRTLVAFMANATRSRSVKLLHRSELVSPPKKALMNSIIIDIC